MKKNKDRIITSDYIASLNPCQDRFDNWSKHYPKWKGPLSRFLGLKKITYTDKMWVFFRTINRTSIPLVAADFAERTLSIYESAFPNDLRPRRAIEAARSGKKANAAANDAAYAAVYAANDAANDAYAAAYAATLRKKEELTQIKIMRKVS